LNSKGVAIGLFIIVSLGTGLIYADTGIKGIEHTVMQTIDTEIETQKIHTDWQDEKFKLEKKFESLLAANENLKKNLLKIEAAYDAEKEKNEELNRREEQITRIKKDLNRFLEEAVLKLEKFVETDLPFHPDERQGRVNGLKKLLYNEEIMGAEKYRQIFEALKIETDFGRTIEVYQKEIDIDNESKTVDILRIGRVSLFYLTLDKTRSGFFNLHSRRFEGLESKFNAQIEKGIAIAKGEQISEFVNLPFGRIVK
jgi:transcriptional regulator of heat shock response